ncbi:hypothetical protein B0I31_11833 [Saccharothrix carnea]|uniref:Uncharacterized protein n=1 Tax=Saccharothrix carnea TaxID=1280637 RepID=A0A2P8HZR7_SACCR|nr:hypothetical protein [Saccharothrix carnea]PSL51720.1 hypothetical protein B0I31_11833 [Saccharothrix carnea]
MSRVDRRRVELDVKLAAIEHELALWFGDTGRGLPLRKHRSQLGRVVETLRGLLGRVAEQVELIGPDSVDTAYEAQENLLEAYRVWEFFRSKFALRYQDGYRRPLAVADEYAWACYRPVLRAARSARPDLVGKEPPLVHLSGAFSPYAHLRGDRFTVEEPAGALNSDAFQRVVLSLPVPVVGMPWHQVRHLPDFPLLAHEAGHCVDHDFELADDIEDHLYLAVRDLPAARRADWDRWGSEAFADCFATLAAGPAYVSALADFLSAPGPPAEGPSAHPPPDVRLSLTLAALDVAGLTTHADALRRDLGPSSEDSPHALDAPSVAAALLGEPHPWLGGRALKEVVTFSARHQDDAVAAMTAVLDRRRPRPSDVRTLVAAARLAFDHAPREFTAVQDVVLQRAVDAIDDGTRAATDRRDGGPGDREAGAALFDLINEARGAAR